MIVIGADESGTGAWAGPFTVCAVGIHQGQEQLLYDAGARDSKSLSGTRRREIFDTLVDLVVVGKCEVVSVEDMRRQGKQTAWRNAMLRAIQHVWNIAVTNGEGTVIIDGANDAHLGRMLWAIGCRRSVFMPKADAKNPVVGAASVIAKTLRSRHMEELDKIYPEYNWKVNDGYGTPEHNAIIQKLGKTEYHRPWKNLVDVPYRQIPFRSTAAVLVNMNAETYDVYIGRQGRNRDGYFGNPIRHSTVCQICGQVHTNGGQTLDCYKIYFDNRIATDTEFKTAIEGLRGKRLGCFCFPGRCHGDVIIDYLNR